MSRSVYFLKGGFESLNHLGEPQPPFEVPPEALEGSTKRNMKGWMYILECTDGSYYTGSTNNLELRLAQHQAGEGANHTRKRLPVTLIYYEEYDRVQEAFYITGKSRFRAGAEGKRKP